MLDRPLAETPVSILYVKHSIAWLPRLLYAALAVGALMAGGLPVAQPEAVGLSSATLQSAVEVYQQAVEADDHRGVVLLVARRGKIALHEALGFRDFDSKLPMEKDTLFRMASNTKPVIATAILMLAEDGKLSLDDNVRKHLPSWDNYRAGWIQVRHLLSHTSGLRIAPIFLDPLLPNASLQKEVERFGEIGAEVPPGTSFSYNNPGFNTLGALIEIRGGQPLEAFLKERIYQPLGMRDSLNHESRADMDRMSTVYSRDEEGKWKVEWKPDDESDYPFVRASGGMISTAADYIRFCEMWRNGGELEGARLLKSESVAAGWTAFPHSKHGDDGARHYGFGWFGYDDGSWGHGGSDGTFALVSPKEELIVLIFGQSRGARITALRERFVKLVRAAILD